MFSQLMFKISAAIEMPTLKNLNLQNNPTAETDLSFCWPTQSHGLFHVIPLENGSQIVLTIIDPSFWKIGPPKKNAHKYWPFLAPKQSMTYLCRILDQSDSIDDDEKKQQHLEECTRRFNRAIEFASQKHANPITVVIVFRKLIGTDFDDVNTLLKEYLFPLDKRMGFFEIPEANRPTTTVGTSLEDYWHVLFTKFRIRSGPKIGSLFYPLQERMLTTAMNCSHEISASVFPSVSFLSGPTLVDPNGGDKLYTYIPTCSNNTNASAVKSYCIVACFAPKEHSETGVDDTSVRWTNGTNPLQVQLTNMYNWINALCQLSDYDDIGSYLNKFVFNKAFNMSMIDHVDFVKLKLFDMYGSETIYGPHKGVQAQIADLAKWSSFEEDTNEFIVWPWYLLVMLRAHNLSCSFPAVVNSLFGPRWQTIGYQMEYLNKLEESTSVCQRRSELFSSSDEDDFLARNKISGCKIPLFDDDNNRNDAFQLDNFLFCRRQVFYKVTNNPLDSYFYINLTQLARYNDIFFAYESMVYRIRFEYFGERPYLIYQSMGKHDIDYKTSFLDSALNQLLMEQIVYRLGLYMSPTRTSANAISHGTCGLVMFSREREIATTPEQNILSTIFCKKWTNDELVVANLDLNTSSDLIFNTTEQQSTMINIWTDIQDDDMSIHCIIYEIDLTFDRHSINNKILTSHHFCGTKFINLIVKNQSTTVVRFFSESNNSKQMSVIVQNKNILPSKNF